MIPTLGHLRSPVRLRRALLGVCAAWLLLGGPPPAMSQDSAKKTAGGAPQDSAKKAAAAASQDTAKRTAAADSAKPLTPDQLDALVAPIALYPDDLLGQTLAASTYPLEIVQLQQWLAKNPGLKDKALADSVAKQPWDPSIKSMAAVPELVKRLADDIQWTTELGNAFLAQQNDVMEACQRMRKKAKDKGTLETTEQQKVETKVVEKKEVIVIESQNPEIVYVPSYSPTVVYGPPVYPYPPIYYPYYPPGAAFVSFSVGMMWGAAMWGGSCCYARWGGGGVYNDIDINVDNNFNRVEHNERGDRGDRGNQGNRGQGNRGQGNRGGGGSWQHNPQHRGGAPYADARTAEKFGGQRGAGASDRAAGAGQGQRGAGVSDRSAGAGQGQRAGVSDRSAAGGQGQRGAGVSDRSAGAGAGGSRPGGDQIGNRSIPSDRGGGSGGFGGSRGYDGGSARASSSRGSRSYGGGGGFSRGGGGRRR